MKFPSEPFKIKVVEPLKITTREEREALIRRAVFNLFNIPAESFYVDLLTDSGTSAMSDNQWAGLMLGDESYAGSKNYTHFEAAVKDIFGYEYVITTRATVEYYGGTATDLPRDDALHPSLEAPFKGNMDLSGLDRVIHEQGRSKIPLVMMTITNNSAGGQPVSMENARAVRSICRKHGVPLFFDARSLRREFILHQGARTRISRRLGGRDST